MEIVKPTNAANNKNFRCPSITIPSIQLFLARRTSVLSSVLWTNSVRWFWVGVHVGRPRERSFVISIDGRRRRDEGNLGAGARESAVWGSTMLRMYLLIFRRLEELWVKNGFKGGGSKETRDNNDAGSSKACKRLRLDEYACK